MRSRSSCGQAHLTSSMELTASTSSNSHLSMRRLTARRIGTITGRKLVDARSYSVHLGQGITSPRCTVGRVNQSNSAFYQSKGRVDGSLDEPMDPPNIKYAVSSQYLLKQSFDSMIQAHLTSSMQLTGPAPVPSQTVT